MNVCFQVKYFDGYEASETHYQYGNPDPCQMTWTTKWFYSHGNCGRAITCDWSPSNVFWEGPVYSHETRSVAPRCGHGSILR